MHGNKRELWEPKDKGDPYYLAKERDQGSHWGEELMGLFLPVITNRDGEENVTEQSLYFFQPQKGLWLIHTYTALRPLVF